MPQSEPIIHSLINHHFCIQKSDSNNILNTLKAVQTDSFLFDKDFDWEFLSEVQKKRFVLFDKIDDWNYLIWNIWDFEENRKQTLLLSEKLQTKVYYFFIDPWIFTCRWVLAENGKLIKSYHESHDTILNDEGYLEIETNIRNVLKQKGEKEFWEDKFWKLYETICQPIDILNSMENINAVKGEIK